MPEAVSWPSALLIMPFSCKSGADAMPLSSGKFHSPRQSRYIVAIDRGRAGIDCTKRAILVLLEPDKGGRPNAPAG